MEEKQLIIDDYLNSLEKDVENLRNNLSKIGIENIENATFTEIADKLEAAMISAKTRLVNLAKKTGVHDVNEDMSLTDLLSQAEEPFTVLYPDFDLDGIDLTHVDLTKDCMIFMFQRLKDLSNEEEGKNLTLGLDNYSKLTVNELNIATKKGWHLY